MLQTSKYATKVNYKTPVILPESTIYCLENCCQIRWTTAESERKKYSKVMYLISKHSSFGCPHSIGFPGTCPVCPEGKQVPADHYI